VFGKSGHSRSRAKSRSDDNCAGPPVNTLLKDIQKLAANAAAAAEQAGAAAKALAASMEEAALVDKATRQLLLCETIEEVAAVVRSVTPSLLPRTSGELMIVRSDGRPGNACIWGKAESVPPSRRFGLEDCWSYRQATPYLVHDPASEVLCLHVPPLLEGAYACVPVAGQGRIWGVLHVRCEPRASDDSAAGAYADFVDHATHIAQALAGSIGVTVSRLNARESLHMQAIHDPLTGLYNRRYMEDALDRIQAHAEKHRGTFGLVAIDIDRFKPVNDTFGHAAGDTLLKAIASFLTSIVRVEDTVCRFGGEEFVILMPNISLDAAVQRAELIRSRLSELRVQHDGRSLTPVTASIGVAAFPEHGHRWTTVLEEADAALYQAKQDGRNAVRVAASRRAEL
jgi:diguanylate cyclase (GGDEF)-like protein